MQGEERERKFSHARFSGARTHAWPLPGCLWKASIGAGRGSIACPLREVHTRIRKEFHALLHLSPGVFVLTLCGPAENAVIANQTPKVVHLVVERPATLPCKCHLWLVKTAGRRRRQTEGPFTKVAFYSLHHFGHPFAQSRGFRGVKLLPLLLPVGESRWSSCPCNVWCWATEEWRHTQSVGIGFTGRCILLFSCTYFSVAVSKQP